MKLLQNCWLVPSNQQSYSRCGSISATSSGQINCDVNAPENPFIGISKEVFASLADRWSSPANFADECFNDVVNRSLCAGINPLYSLMMWLHESDASNYTFNPYGPVEDFGIHVSGVSPENFVEQITYFLRLDPGAYCVNDPRINGNYWLGWTADMLNGSCDPNQLNSFSGDTVLNTLQDFQYTWGAIAGTGTPMPATIHVSPAGQSCP